MLTVPSFFDRILLQFYFAPVLFCSKNAKRWWRDLNCIATNESRDRRLAFWEQNKTGADGSMVRQTGPVFWVPYIWAGILMVRHIIGRFFEFPSLLDLPLITYWGKLEANYTAYITTDTLMTCSREKFFAFISCYDLFIKIK